MGRVVLSLPADPIILPPDRSSRVKMAVGGARSRRNGQVAILLALGWSCSKKTMVLLQNLSPNRTHSQMLSATHTPHSGELALFRKGT